MTTAPNLLFITADQLRADCLGCSGHEVLRTPHLDALARRGVRFARHFTNAAPCASARACIHTGLYMANHRVVFNGVPLNSDITNWAAELKKSTGVAPALIGYTDQAPDPRHLEEGDPRLKRWDGGFLDGFDNLSEKNDLGSPSWLERMGVAQKLGESTMSEIRKPGFVSWNGFRGEPDWLEVAKGMEARIDAPPLPNGFPAPAAYGPEASDTYVLTNQAIDFIRTKASRKERWALHLSLLKPHPPFLAPEPYNEKYHPSAVDLPKHRASDFSCEAAVHPYLEAEHRAGTSRPLVVHDTGSLGNVSDSEMRLLRASYYGLISEVDDNIGRLLAALGECGEDSRTLIVFTTDHGEMLGDHWFRGKLGFYDGAFHIPLLVRDPRPEADSTRGSVVTAFTEHVDIAPTLLDYSGAFIPEHFDGRSLRPFLEATVPGSLPSGWRLAAHWEFDFRHRASGEVLRHSRGLGMRDCSLAVLRTSTRKLVQFGSSDLPPLLFDLEADPGELRNIAGDAKYSADMQQLLMQLLTWRSRHLGCNSITHLQLRTGSILSFDNSGTCKEFSKRVNGAERRRSRSPNRKQRIETPVALLSPNGKMSKDVAFYAGPWPESVMSP